MCTSLQDFVTTPPMILTDFCPMPVQYECVAASMAYGPPPPLPGSNAMGSLLPPFGPQPSLMPHQPLLHDGQGPSHNTRSKRASMEACLRPQCYICGKRFDDTVHLRNHMELHASFSSEADGLVGGDTKMAGDEEMSLIPPGPPPRRSAQHTQALQASSSSSLHSCYICTKKFKQVGHLNNHVRLHTGEKPYECQVCKKKFTQSGHLLSHTRMHTNHRPYECKYCNKSFTQSGHLSNHERLHSGERPYQCNVCSKRFTQSGHLSNHTRLHSGERPFECQVCSKTFTQSGHLNNHMRLHTGGRPHSCAVCGKRFTQTGHLSNHMRMHTGERPYDCLICDKSFAQSGHLANHLRSHQGLTLGTSSTSCSARIGGIPPPPRPAPHIIKLTPATREQTLKPKEVLQPLDSQEQLGHQLEPQLDSQLDSRLDLGHDLQLNPQFDSQSDAQTEPDTDPQALLDMMTMPEAGLDT